MDFLDIRKKAKERAQARADEETAKKERAGAEKATASGPASASRPPLIERRRRRTDRRAEPPPVPPADPAVTDQDLIDGALAARLQGLPAPEAMPPAPELAAAEDGRFTTWRPSSGAPPPVVPEPDDPRALGSSAQFTVFPTDTPFAAPGSFARSAHPSRPQSASEPADPLEDFFYRPDEAAPPVPRLAPDEGPPEEHPALLAREEYLTFLLGAEEYAVAIERVHEVLKAPPITEVPRAPAHVLGVVTVRGKVVAVLDPRRRLGLSPASLGEGEGRVVVMDAGEGSCGLLVDRVASVVRLRAGSIEPCPQGIAGQRSEFVSGIGRVGDRLFTVLDVAALLRRTPPREEPAIPRRPDAAP